MQTVFISGVSRGIGLAAARRLAGSGSYRVIGTSTRGTGPDQKENLFVHKLDLLNPSSIDNLAGNLRDEHIDVLINNAGILLDHPDSGAVSLNTLETTFRANLFGTVRLTEALLPGMKKGGRIINISSSWGAFSEDAFFELHPHYKMSKAALNMYTRLLAERLKGEGIAVAALDPGWVQTDMGSREAPRTPADVAEDIGLLLEHLAGNPGDTVKFWYKGRVRDW